MKLRSLLIAAFIASCVVKADDYAKFKVRSGSGYEYFAVLKGQGYQWSLYRLDSETVIPMQPCDLSVLNFQDETLTFYFNDSEPLELHIIEHTLDPFPVFLIQ